MKNQGQDGSEAQAHMEIRRYKVFISYRHADNLEMGRKWANWLHEALEAYEIPEDLAGAKNLRGDPIPESLYPVFRDEQELPADADLGNNIRTALENSDLLVIICSPRAVGSRFVSEEIRYFKELGKSDRIIAMVIDGEPNASDDPTRSSLECFPEPLRYGTAGQNGKLDWTARTEPIAADVRPEGRAEQGWTSATAYRQELERQGRLGAKEIQTAVKEYGERLELAKLKVVAGALGVALGTLTRRDKAFQLAKARQRAKVLRRWLSGVTVLAVAAAVAGALAWQQKKTAEEASYVGGIRAASLLLREGNRNAARQTLATLPQNLRKWEWGHLLQECGAPAWKVDLPLQKDTQIHPSAEISERLIPEAQKLLAESRPDDAERQTMVKSPDGKFIAVFDFGFGRSGACLCLLETPTGEENSPANEESLDPSVLATSRNPKVVFSMWTGRYGGRIESARFSSDGSVLIVEAPAQSSFSGPNEQSPSTVPDAEEGERKKALFFVPVPARLESPPATVHGDERTIRRTAWQTMRFAQLPPEIQSAVEGIEKFDQQTGSLAARFADYHLGADGSYTGLFNVFGSNAAAEVRDLPSGRVLAALGTNIGFDANENYNGDLDLLLEHVEVGGAFSPDATHVVVSPCGPRGAREFGLLEICGPAFVFRVADGSGTRLKSVGSFKDFEDGPSLIGLFPVWGMSPDARYAFRSSYIRTSQVSWLEICSAINGETVENPPSNLRYIGWSPNSSRTYLIENNSSAMLVADPSNFKTLAEIPEVTEPSEWPPFDEFPVYASPDGGRFTIGNLVFGSDPDYPLLRLNRAPDKGPLVSWLLEAMRNNTMPADLKIGDEVLLYWAQRTE